MRKIKKRMSKSDAYVLLIIGIILGNVFVFGQSYWNKTIEPNEAFQACATYISHKESIRRGNTKGIYVSFSDYDKLYIDTVCVNDKLRMQLDEVKEDTKVQMLIHPNSDTILDMRTSDKTFLDFHDVMKKLESEKEFFFILGIGCYFVALIGLIRLLDNCGIVLWWQHKKQEKFDEEIKKFKEKTLDTKNERTDEQKLKKMSRKQRKQYKQKN